LWRFHIVEELSVTTPYRQCHISYDAFQQDFYQDDTPADAIDRKAVLAAFRYFLHTHDLEAEWDDLEEASNETLVNALSMISTWGPAEKQALLEAKTLAERAQTLIAISEMERVRCPDNDNNSLQ
jgi:Lon protease-like protein